MVLRGNNRLCLLNHWLMSVVPTVLLIVTIVDQCGLVLLLLLVVKRHDLNIVLREERDLVDGLVWVQATWHTLFVMDGSLVHGNLVLSSSPVTVDVVIWEDLVSVVVLEAVVKTTVMGTVILITPEVGIRVVSVAIQMLKSGLLGGRSDDGVGTL